MASRREKRRRQRRNQGTNPNVWLAAFIVTVATVGVLGFKFYQSLDKIDGDTGCIVGQPPQKHTVFLVDRSDDFSPRQVNDLRRVLIQTFQELEINELFSIYAIGGDVPSIPSPLGQFCRPPQRANEGNQISGEGFLAQRYERIFDNNVNPILDNLTSPLQSEESPLLEWIVAISESRDFSAPSLEDRRMVIFSDMVQWVPQEDFQYCGRFPSFDQFKGDRYYQRITTSLTNVRVTIYNVRRPNGSNCTAQAQRDMRALEDFWFAYFDDAGATMSPRRFTRIGE